MGYLALRIHFDNLAAPAPRVRERRSSDTTSAGSVSPEPRRVLVPPPPLRGAFSRWLRASAPLGGRSQRLSFGVRADTPSTRQTARAPMPYPLSHVRVLTRDEFAAVHGDGGKDGSFGLTVAPLAAPNNGARGNP